MAKKISKVCITDEKSVQYTATNSLELIEKIKEQIVSKIENGHNLCPIIAITFIFNCRRYISVYCKDLFAYKLLKYSA